MKMNKQQWAMVSLFVNSMYEYQHKHNIIKECITNAQYLYDFLRFNLPFKVKTVAHYVIATDKHNNVFFWPGHLVVVINDNDLIDGSLEVAKYNTAIYYDNIVDFMINVKKMINTNTSHKCFYDGLPIDNNDLKHKSLTSHLLFVNYAQKINNGKLLVVHKDYYNAQADYVESKL